MQDDRRPCVVWCFSDGKAGHAGQTQGLLAALDRRCRIESHELPARRGPGIWLELLSGRCSAGRKLPDPDLIIGAGHATHLSLLAAGRARGGHTVVLMKPSLPTAWFDLCVIPAHDRPRQADNILVTQGVLNRMQPAGDRDVRAGLILVGGPSAHVEWSDDAVLAQLRTVLEQDEGMHWTLTTSRRTPDSFLEALGGLGLQRLQVVPFTDTGPGWLPEQLSHAARVWVTADSVSMVYEALTAGAAVGLLEVPYRKANDRLALGMQQLIEQGLVTGHADWLQGKRLQAPATPFDEAARCADFILQRWPIGS